MHVYKISFMFVVGTCNPAGEADSYNGLYLTDKEIENLVKTKKMQNIPVKTEHCGKTVGHVISAFLNDNRELKCVLEIDENSVEGSLAGGFVWDNIAQDLSLGYVVDVKQSGTKLEAQDKQILEVSLVRKGARKGCHITMCERDDRVFIRKTNCFEPYFNLS